MEPEGSLLHSEVPAMPLYEPHRSSPCPHIPLPEDPSKYYPSMYLWVFQVVLGFPTKGPYTPLLSPYALHAPPISLALSVIGKITASNRTLFSCSGHKRKCAENFPFIMSEFMSILMVKLLWLAVRVQLPPTY
jgi:hypothetical protein